MTFETHNFEDFQAWLASLRRIQESIWASDWEFAIKFRAHALVGEVANVAIKTHGVSFRDLVNGLINLASPYGDPNDNSDIKMAREREMFSGT